MFKKIRELSLLAFAAFMLCFCLGGNASAYEGTYESDRVYVHYLEDGEELFADFSSVLTVGDFLVERGITLTEYETVTPSVDSPLKTSMEIEVTREISIVVRFDTIKWNRGTKIAAPKTTLAKFVQMYQEKTGVEYHYDKALAKTLLTEGMKIDLLPITRKEVVETEDIAFQTHYIETEDIVEGEQSILFEGAVGTLTKMTEVLFADGAELKSEFISSEITLEPVDRVVLVGTGVPLLEIDFEALPLSEISDEPKTEAEIIADLDYLYAVKMSATAYTADYESTGKRPGDKGFGITYSGMVARVGVVAVDPKVIPLGTELYIEGYGFAIAGDTGSAIKGNKVDLYFNTNWECKQFGRQQRMVYVLADA